MMMKYFDTKQSIKMKKVKRSISKLLSKSPTDIESDSNDELLFRSDWVACFTSSSGEKPKNRKQMSSHNF